MAWFSDAYIYILYINIYLYIRHSASMNKLLCLNRVTDEIKLPPPHQTRKLHIVMTRWDYFVLIQYLTSIRSCWHRHSKCKWAPSHKPDKSDVKRQNTLYCLDQCMCRGLRLWNSRDRQTVQIINTYRRWRPWKNRHREDNNDLQIWWS